MKKRPDPPLPMTFKKHRPTGSTNHYPVPAPWNKTKVYRRVDGMLVETDTAGRNRIVQEAKE